MSDEVREAKAGDRESGGGEAGAKLRAAATVNENQEEQITKPAPKVKPQRLWLVADIWPDLPEGVC